MLLSDHLLARGSSYLSRSPSFRRKKERKKDRQTTPPKNNNNNNNKQTRKQKRRKKKANLLLDGRCLHWSISFHFAIYVFDTYFAQNTLCYTCTSHYEQRMYVGRFLRQEERGTMTALSSAKDRLLIASTLFLCLTCV